MHRKVTVEKIIRIKSELSRRAQLIGNRLIADCSFTSGTERIIIGDTSMAHAKLEILRTKDDEEKEILRLDALFDAL